MSLASSILLKQVVYHNMALPHSQNLSKLHPHFNGSISLIKRAYALAFPLFVSGPKVPAHFLNLTFFQILPVLLLNFLLSAFFSGRDAGFPIHGFQVQNHWVAPRSTQSYIPEVNHMRTKNSRRLTINDWLSIVAAYLKAKAFEWALVYTGCLIGPGHLLKKHKIKTRKVRQVNFSQTFWKFV